ncbi:MAG: protein phosphatase CheZ [Nitrosomonas sp.]|nr:protein phosphatase CheZ [Nitrosomonas sp.]
MNTDPLIHEGMEIQRSESVHEKSDVLEVVETRTAEELIHAVATSSTLAVNLSREAFDDSCDAIAPQHMHGYTPDHLETVVSEIQCLVENENQNNNTGFNVEKGKYSDVDVIPEVVITETVEEITSLVVVDVNERQDLSKEITESKPEDNKTVIDQVGHLTRNLHNSLRELGYDRRLESLAAEVPETQDKLSYVATKTEQAADRTLSATEIAMPIQEKLSSEATQLSEKWKNAFEEQKVQPDTEKFKLLLIETLSYIDTIPERTDATNVQLMEIMLAQDFQDLTGQVIKKITTMVQRLEQDLLQLLLANVPSEKRQTHTEDSANLMNGPVTNPEKNPDTVSNQDQVDDLLASLGF